MKVCGRNLAEKITVGSSTNRFATALYIEAKLKPNTTYTLSFIGSVNNYYYLNEYLIQKYTSFVVKEGINTLTFTTKTELPLGEYKSYGWVIAKNDTNNLAENIFNDVMLVEGSTVIPYEPYISGGSLTVSTPNGLPGIPVTSGGNYTDSTGQQWICDSIDFARGKYVQRVHKQVFTQNDNYIMQQENIVRGYSNVKSVDGGAVISTHLKSGPYGGVDSITMGYVGEQIYFSRFATVDDFKLILGDTGMTVYYELATPIETDLTEEQLAAYAAMHTNYPNSTIYNDAGADMEVKYYTPNTAVQMVHSPVDEGKVLAIDEHGCVVLSDDVGGGTISIDLNDVNEGEATPVNADTLGGYVAEDYVLKEYLNNYGLVEKNYSIVGGPNEPENPTENTIWINTENEITDHVISRNEPRSPKEGMIWILDNDNGTVSFHKIKFNDIKVEEIYPISAKQYISNEWVKVDAMIYQGAWEPFWDGTLYESGKEYEAITGGWAFSNGRNGACSNGTWERGATYLRLNTSADPRACQACTVKKIDLTNYKYLKCNATGSGSLQIGTTVEMSNGVARSVGTGNRSLDITAYTGEYYVAIHKYTFNNDATMVWGNFDVTKIWLE